MKIRSLFLLLFALAAVESFSQESKSDHAYTNVYHYGNNITLKNFDGTQSTVFISGNTATLFNADGTQSSIDLDKNSSNLVARDGTISTFSHNGYSSTVFNTDGSRFSVTHMQSTSSCTVANEKHTITHNFGKRKEMRYKDLIDVLIHRNWLIQKHIKKDTKS